MIIRYELKTKLNLDDQEYVARANRIPRGFQEEEKKRRFFLSFASVNALRTCDFGLILLARFLAFYTNLVTWHSVLILARR
jgi:hypothetical protein